jgi:hypothetical protein
VALNSYLFFLAPLAEQLKARSNENFRVDDLPGSRVQARALASSVLPFSYVCSFRTKLLAKEKGLHSNSLRLSPNKRMPPSTMKPAALLAFVGIGRH